MALNNSYDLNDQVRCSAAFTLSSVATDPTTITFTYKTPAGVVTTLTYGVAGSEALVKASTGNYVVDLAASLPGTWHYTYKGTGTVVAASEGKFFVKPTDTV